MSKSEGPSYQLLKTLETAPNMYLVLSPTLHILTASNLYLQAIGTTKEAIVGKHIFEAFPDNPDLPDADGMFNINASLQEVLRTKQPHYMQVQRYDVPDVNNPGKFIQRYWNPSHTPILDEDGEIHYIIQLATNVTDIVLAEQALTRSRADQQETLEQVQKLNVELAASNQQVLHSQESLQQLNTQLEERIAERTKELSESEARFRSLIELSPIAQQVFRGDDLILEVANDAMLRYLGKGKDIIGKPMLTAVPEIEGQPVVEQIYHVYHSGEPVELKAEKVVLQHNGTDKVGYYNVSYRALYDNGEITGVLGVAIDVTEQVISRQALEESKDRYKSLIENSPAAMLVFRGEDLVFETVNGAMLQLLDKTADIIGKPLLEGLPEVKGQPIVDIIYEVYHTGKSFSTPGIGVELNRNGKLETGYFNITYRALYEGGRITGIIEAAVEVTEEVKAKSQIQQLNDELAATNEEQAASNEELAEVNDELLRTQTTLETIIKQLEASHSRFQNLVRDARVGIIVLTGDNMKVEIVNEAYARMIGRNTQELLNRALFEIIPETEAYFRPIIDKVRLTGEPVYLYDTPYTVHTNDKAIHGYLDLVYQPYRDDTQTTIGTIVLCHDVTEQVNAKMQIMESNERLQIAVDAGALGYTEVDLASGEMVCNERFKVYYGRTKDEHFTYDDLFDAILPEYRDEIRKRVAIASAEHTLYQATYQVAWPDGSLHWINAHGRARYDEEGNAIRMVGLISDVTEQKKDEQRKNDFIAMVSHELKTPLTSMKAYIQVLKGKASKAEDTFNTNLLDKANIQVVKMTSMINGFLNVSRLESGQIHIDKQLFNMADLVKETEEESMTTISSHRLIFAPVEYTPVIADQEKIGQVINNLISNAVKYSPSGSTIQVACVTVENEITVSVRDEGFGIAPGDLQRLFDRYYRVRGENMKTISGFGIGLYLCSEIIQRHNGRIWVESEVGKGSTFYFMLPSTSLTAAK
jgi:two-component system sensor histidine kinase VicK